MTPFSAPGAAALVATVLALLLHPRLGLAAALPEPEGLAAALALLLVVALWARGDRLLAGAAVLALVGLGYDSARGVEGTLRLNPGDPPSPRRPQLAAVRPSEVRGGASRRLVGN